VFVFGDHDVLELKFTNRAPEWIRELVRLFHLRQSGGAKYAGGIRLMGEDHYAGRRLASARYFTEAAQPQFA
jgi:hypothetical protein